MSIGKPWLGSSACCASREPSRDPERLAGRAPSQRDPELLQAAENRRLDWRCIVLCDAAVMRWLVLVLVAGCALKQGDKNDCTQQADCLDGYVCVAGMCQLPDSCVPKTCEANQCEMIDDGCGAKVDCGGCPNGQQCGLVEPNQCG